MTKDKKSLADALPEPLPANHDSDEVMVQHSEAGVGVYVLSLGWDGPYAQVYKYKLAERLPAGASEEEIEQAVEKTKNNKKYFGTCEACGDRALSGYMLFGCCHACAPSQHGVVF